jgi:c-di-GMP-binding flagellar brake protein YcgR
MQRRQYERCDCEVPLYFSWEDPEGASHQASGTVRNISAGGVFISSDYLPPVRSRIRFNLYFRAFLASSHLVMRTTAEVLRMQKDGFAAMIKAYALLRDDKVIE